jgi:hypothetical protein
MAHICKADVDPENASFQGIATAHQKSRSPFPRPDRGTIMRDLPTGTQSFVKVIRDDLLYADKTEFIHRLIKRSASYFLTRPRRFGKSLLLDTMEKLFSGQRELFEGLWIAESGYEFKPHPVIKLTMNYAETGTADLLKENILGDLRKIASKNKVTVDETLYDRYLVTLVENLAEKSENGVVILVDEYDAPITRNLGNMEAAEANRNVLHGFYSKLKELDKYLRFTFVTGLTRFAMTALDSGPNHFTDISLDAQYEAICGFTVEDLDRLFGDRMEATLSALRSGTVNAPETVPELKQLILDWYDGYNWGGAARILNPFSILNFFQNNKFSSYWFDSGRPSHWRALIRQHPADYIAPKLDKYSSQTDRKADLFSMEPASILFHAGYLTVDNVKSATEMVNGEETTTEYYSFRLPNREVRQMYPSCFVSDLLFDKSDLDYFSAKAEDFLQAFLAKDPLRTADLYRDVLARITYYQSVSSERDCHVVFQFIFNNIKNISVRSETLGSRGRSDLAYIFPDKTCVIMEIKHMAEPKPALDENARNLAMDKSLDVASKQMAERDYAGPYRDEASRIIALALTVYGRDMVKVRYL